MRADIGIIGGSGFYDFFADAESVVVDTPFGEPSAPVSVGEVAGRSVAFLPRHGRRHQFPPHRVNYRANLWALRAIGVRQVVAPCAVGGLRADLEPGTFVVPDQVVDRTWGRPHTVWDAIGPVVHTSFADPYCPTGRDALLAADASAVDGGTLVVINGPRFSSRAESQWHAAAGWSVVGMTGMPEASVARELAMCFSTVCMITDADAGVEGPGVSHAEVMQVFAGNIERLKSMLVSVIGALPAPEPDATASCLCRRALDGQRLPFELP
ncbi:MAG: S-methyl-5'-thioadenosine phosphorylase [Micropruina sp.]|uniref:S-methyl-5'-thioadenosine phosphorylase n=1 Tax=Micropruina sp. TaxID=2737536 RepID=UPI0039E6FE4C